MSEGVKLGAINQLEKTFLLASNNPDLQQLSEADNVYASVDTVIEEISKMKNLDDYTYVVTKQEFGSSINLTISLVPKEK